MIGMSEQRLREHLESALVHAMRAEGGVPTIHAIATSVARVLDEDHAEIEEQLTAAGVHLDGHGTATAAATEATSAQ
jgi:hypothetical protein